MAEPPNKRGREGSPFNAPNDDVPDDVVIQVEEKEFKYSKIHLAGHSRYFHRKFFSSYAEKDRKDVILKGVKEQDFALWLKVIDGEGGITDDSVGSLLRLTQYLEANGPQQECHEFLLKDSEKDIKEKFKLADRFRLEELLVQILSTIRSVEELKNIVQLTDIPSLNSTTQTKILERIYKMAELPEISVDEVYQGLLNEALDNIEEQEERRKAEARHDAVREPAQPPPNPVPNQQRLVPQDPAQARNMAELFRALARAPRDYPVPFVMEIPSREQATRQRREGCPHEFINLQSYGWRHEQNPYIFGSAGGVQFWQRQALPRHQDNGFPAEHLPHLEQAFADLHEKNYHLLNQAQPDFVRISLLRTQVTEQIRNQAHQPAPARQVQRMAGFIRFIPAEGCDFWNFSAPGQDVRAPQVVAPLALPYRAGYGIAAFRERLQNQQNQFRQVQVAGQVPNRLDQQAQHNQVPRVINIDALAPREARNIEAAAPRNPPRSLADELAAHLEQHQNQQDPNRLDQQAQHNQAPRRFNVDAQAPVRANQLRQPAPPNRAQDGIAELMPREARPYEEVARHQALRAQAAASHERLQNQHNQLRQGEIDRLAALDDQLERFAENAARLARQAQWIQPPAARQHAQNLLMAAIRGPGQNQQNPAYDPYQADLPRHPAPPIYAPMFAAQYPPPNQNVQDPYRPVPDNRVELAVPLPRNQLQPVLPGPTVGEQFIQLFPPEDQYRAAQLYGEIEALRARGRVVPAPNNERVVEAPNPPGDQIAEGQ